MRTLGNVSSCDWQVMDLCSGGDFFDFLSYRGCVTEDEARALFLQACLAPIKHYFVHRETCCEIFKDLAKRFSNQ